MPAPDLVAEGRSSRLGQAGDVSITPVARRRPAVSRATLRRRRQAALALFVALLVGGALLLHGALGWIGGGPLTAADRPGGLRPVSTRVWVVRPGDTLWDIAVAVDGNRDPRPLVDELSAQVGGLPLQVGERLTLPGT